MAYTKAKYHKISYKWHSCLGFGAYLDLRPAVIKEITTLGVNKVRHPKAYTQEKYLKVVQPVVLGKRKQGEIEDNIKSWVKE